MSKMINNTTFNQSTGLINRNNKNSAKERDKNKNRPILFENHINITEIKKRSDKNNKPL